jgi:hypothetical protein
VVSSFSSGNFCRTAVDVAIDMCGGISGFMAS